MNTNKSILSLALAVLLALPLAVSARVPKRIYLEKTRVACVGNRVVSGAAAADAWRRI